MKRRRRLYHTAAVLATSLAAFGPSVMAKGGGSEKKKARASTERTVSSASVASGDKPKHGSTRNESPSTTGAVFRPRPMPLESPLTASLGVGVTLPTAVPGDTRYPWKNNIVTTTFWIGEDAAPNNPVPNAASSWDENWSTNYGGVDTPKHDQRTGYLPAAFVPQQNPFYVALPYNDINSKGHKPEAAALIPWFKDDFTAPGKTVLKGRWIAIRFKGRVAYAQWEDCGPFRTDHAAYVFGDERPKPNLNKGAGLDVSPAVRDYLQMNDTDVTDWRFVDFPEVPQGPWATYGTNNTFVQRQQSADKPVVLLNTIAPAVR